MVRYSNVHMVHVELWWSVNKLLTLYFCHRYHCLGWNHLRSYAFSTHIIQLLYLSRRLTYEKQSISFQLSMQLDNAEIRLKHGAGVTFANVEHLSLCISLK